MDRIAQRERDRIVGLMGDDGRTILLVEDDPQVQAAVKRVADRLGHRLIQTMRGAHVLELAAEHRPDLVVLDLMLPDTDGRDVLSKLKAGPQTSAIPVLVWSGRTDADAKRIALELGAEDYVEKFDAQTLMRKAERVLLHSEGPSTSGTHPTSTEQKEDAASTHGKRTG